MILTSLPEQVLQILPANVEWQLNNTVNICQDLGR